MKKATYLLAFAIIGFAGCSEDDADSDHKDAATVMNENIQLPPASFTVDPDTMTQSTDVTLTPSPEGTMGINTGVELTTNIGFTATNGATVVAGGIRFGDSGPIQMVPVNTNGQASGTLNIPFSISQATCDDIESICHAVKCYEFAMTADGKITAENIMDVALLCGACDKPSCQDFCCDPGELKIVSSDITIDGVQGSWGSCDVNAYQTTSDPEGGAGFTVGENAMFDNASYRIVLGGYNLNGGTADIHFSEGRVITTFTQSGGFDIQLDPPIDSGDPGLRAMDYEGPNQGTVTITKYEDDGSVNEEIIKLTINFSNVICEEWQGSTKTINGTIAIERQ